MHHSFASSARVPSRAPLALSVALSLTSVGFRARAETADTPRQQTESRSGDSAGVEVPSGAQTYSQASDWKDRTYILADHGYHSPPVADVNIPVLYMGLYLADPVKFTRNARPEDRGSHLFWDVGFGEQIYLLGYDYYDAQPNLPGGLALFIEAGAFMLLDFNADSAAVIDTDYRLGGGIVGRGLPFFPSLKAFGWRYRFFHESTHLGDEFVINALEDPTFARINVSYEAHEFLLSWAVASSAIGAQCYAAYSLLQRKPYEVNEEPEGSRNEFRGGLDLRVPWPSRTPAAEAKREHERLRLRPKNIVGGVELTYREQYSYAQPRQENGTDLSWNSVLGLEWYDALDPGTRLRLLGRFFTGANPRGQLRDQNLTTGGLMLQADL